MNKFSILFFISLLLLVDGCSTKKTQIYSDDTSSYESEVDKKTYSHPTMKPYVIRGIKYSPTVVSVGDEFKGNASWYGPNFNGKLTSNGETYDMYDMTAAHKTLPMDTIVKVTNTRDGSNTVVRINDRGPFVATRIIDLSKSAAEKINVFGPGTAPVTIKILGFYSNGKKTIPTEKELKNFPQNQSLSGFAIQIAAFANINGAIKTQEKYDKTDGYRTVIKDVDKGEGRLYRVYLKGFKSEQEARDYISSSSFNDAFIVRED